jgi:serine/threonine protein phosphatase PrpC
MNEMSKEKPESPRIDQVLIRMCGRLQQELVNNGLFSAETSGTTVSGVVSDYRKGKIYSFNVGDSRSVLVQNHEGEKYY